VTGRDTPPRTGVEELYPFLYAGESDLERVLADVAHSTVEKATEIVALRRRVAEEQGDRLTAAAAAMAARFAAGGRLFSFGNGGSSTDAADVAQLFLHPPRGRPLPAFCLTSDVAILTALANDVGFDVVFARQLAAFGRASDMALGISTSGGSENVLRAFEEAGRRGLLTVGLAGYDGGRMAESGLVDHLFVIPSSSVHRIQEAQTTAYHVLWSLVQNALPSATAV
jgi:D-sedoheptulose 7-phosphate isomerase